MKKFFLIFSIVISTFLAKAQKVEISCQEQSLNSLLVELRDHYQLKLSFDDDYLGQFKITAKQNFSSPGKAFDFLLKDLPVAYEKVGDLYLFYKKKNRTQILKNYLLSGRVANVHSLESLPYTHLLINGIGLASDQNGNFSFVCQKDSIFHLRALYLGYFQLDTVIFPGKNQLLLLEPTHFKLAEIKVKGLRVAKSLQVGNQPAVLRLNHQVARYLPGNGDNSVFNLLRLQPGILAAGEQSNDLVIWGSYEGQTQVLFDGFTLFDMKNFNDNISAVNPFMAKDIQVLKGAYSADHGGRVGGLVNITGVDGDLNQPRLNLSVNNMTLNSMLSIPVTQQSAMVLAFRQTYYELYDSQQLSFKSGRGNNSPSTIDRTLYPDYNFRDLNFKYSGTNKNGDLYSLSTLIEEDRFTNSMNIENNRMQISYEDHEHNKQYGISAFYQKKWWNGSRTKLSVAFSTLDTEVKNVRQTGRVDNFTGGSGQSQGPGSNGQGGSQPVSGRDVIKLNQVAEATIELKHHIPLAEKHQLEIGTGMIYNEVSFEEDSFEVIGVKQQFDGSRLNAYVQDAISISPNMDVKLGVRGSYSFNLKRYYFQPRFSASIGVVDGLKINLAAGRHNQFISRSSLIDKDGNYHYLWSVCDNQSIPVLEATHLVAGVTYHQNNFTFSVEGFDKKITGLTRYVDNLRVQDLYRGDSKTKGMDVFLKQDYKGHSAWISYTLSETMERFDYFLRPVYRRALQDQRHELKAAVLMNFNPFHFSANYVYGSGFPDLRMIVDGEFERDYNRLDLAATYTWNTKKFNLEGGLSILNVLNYANLKYANFITVPDDQDTSLNLYAEAIPFTPTVFLHFSF